MNKQEFEILLQKAQNGDANAMYQVALCYEDGIVEIGNSASRYTTQTSDSGFTVLQDGVEMTSMVKNTVSAPVIEAKRQFQVGKYVLRAGTDGGLLFL